MNGRDVMIDSITMRKNRGIKNLFYGLLSFVITACLGVLIPRLFIISYGSEINGLISSIKQIFVYFSLLEAGVGMTTRQALYGAFSENNNKSVSQILSATNYFYKRTGIYYFFLVIILAVVYPLCVNSTIPTYLIVCIILLQGEAGVAKYLVSGKLQLMLNADGRNYVVSNIATIFTILSNVARVALLYLGFGVLWVQCVFCVIDVFQVIVIVIYTKRNYGWLDLKEKPNIAALSQKNAVIWQQVSGLVFNNTDIVILTVFCNLKVVSVYSMYLTFYAMIANIIGYFSSSFSFAFGQIFHENRDRFCKIQNVYENIYLSLCFVLYTVTYIFILPFMKLYTAGVTDINYVQNLLPAIFLVCQLLDTGRATSSAIINFGQHFEQTKWRCIFEAIINIVVSLVAVNKFGIYGVLFGTLAALLYRTNDMILYANKKVLGRSALPTYKRWLRNFLLNILCIFFSKLLPNVYSGYIPLIVTAAVVFLIVFALFFAINIISEKETKVFIKDYLQKKNK